MFASITVAALLLALLLSASGSSPRGGAVVVTYPALAPDVEQLLCSGDRLEVLVPPGMDPHEYQITVKGLEKLRGARLIVSSGHTPFETTIRRLHSEGELGGELLDVLQLEGIRVLANPVTGSPNYHAILYDPGNYKVFIEALARLLAETRPDCAEHYLEKAQEITRLVDTIVNTTPRLRVVAAATSPLAQYAVAWAGVEVRYLLVEEHESPPTTRSMALVEEAIASGKAGLIVIVEGEQASVEAWAARLAEKYGIPLIRIPSPLSSGTMLERIEEVSRQLESLASAYR